MNEEEEEDWLGPAKWLARVHQQQWKPKASLWRPQMGAPGVDEEEVVVVVVEALRTHSGDIIWRVPPTPLGAADMARVADKRF